MLRTFIFAIMLSIFGLSCSTADSADDQVGENNLENPRNSVEGDDDDDGEASNPATEARAHFEAMYDILHRGRCEAVFECPEQSPGEVVAHSRYATLDECLNDRRPLLREEESVLTGVEAGRALFDAEMAAICRSDTQAVIDARKCDGGWPHIKMPRSCAQVFEGMVADDGDCTSTQECGLDAYCDKAVYGAWEESCFGKCLERSANCGDAWCDAASTFCNEDDECEPYRSEGESCTDELWSQCDAGLTCDGGVCIPAYSVGEGEPCSNLDACQAGLFCGEERTCIPHPDFQFVGEGEACELYPVITEFGGSEDICSMGLICDPATETCAAPGAAGDACSGSHTCEASNYCLPVDPADANGPRACDPDPQLLTAICED